MDLLNEILGTANALAWGWPTLILILGTGFFLMARLGFMPLRSIGLGFRMVAQGRKTDKGEGDISSFAALMTALAATVGTGNIAGVATAIAAGGPGALFWMWCTALVGMATKYAEVVLAVHYREQDENGNFVGGPMYAIKNGLGPKWKWLGILFALFGGFAAFGIGNAVQANSVADALSESFGWDQVWIAVVMTGFVGAVVLGGIRSIGAVASALVPFMCVAYVIAAVIVLVINFGAIPEAFGVIFEEAFTGSAVAGGAVGAAIRYGVARGVFSNEAGLGTAGIAQAAGVTNDPVRSGLIGMMGTFIDTIIICTLTGLAIVTSGLYLEGVTGAPLTAGAFEAALPGAGGIIVAVTLAVFAFTTILGWSYYAEKCWEFLGGVKLIAPFRLVWVAIVPIGIFLELDMVWGISDTLNALMAIPNLVALLALSGVVVVLTKGYFNKGAA